MSSSTPRNREKHFAFADGPLAEYAQQFKGHMEAQHYLPHSAARFRRIR